MRVRLLSSAVAIKPGHSAQKLVRLSKSHDDINRGWKEAKWWEKAADSQIIQRKTAFTYKVKNGRLSFKGNFNRELLIDENIAADNDDDEEEEVLCLASWF